MKEQENINGLIKALSYKDSQIRAKAAESLSSMNYDTKIAMALYNNVMSESNTNVRKSIIIALGKMGEKVNVKDLIDGFLRGTNKTHFTMFAGVIDKVYPIKIIQMLVEVLNSKDEASEVREMAAKTLEMIGIKPSEDVLSEISEKLKL